MWQRFTYNGASAKQQAVFFFNTKEIIDNKFGTAAPIPFQDWSHPIPNQMTNTLTPLRVEVKCFGKYTFRIADPALFMSKLAGTADIYKKDELVEQLRTEVMSVFQNVANELGTAKYKVPVLEMPSQTDEIREMMDEKVFDAKIRERGIEIVCFAVESVTLTDDSAKKIDDYELSSNSYMQQGRMVGAYSNAVENAAKNENGAANGFMGIGMMNMSTNGMMQNAANGPWNQNNDASRMDLSKQEEAKADDTTAEGWTCECGHVNPADGKFCSECGKAKTSKKVCPKCKMPNDAGNKFCNNCGEQL